MIIKNPILTAVPENRDERADTDHLKPRWYNPDMIGRVRAYVEAGGHILVGFRSFFADENLLIYPDRQPHGLTDVFGIHYSRFTKDAVHEWMDLLEADTAEVLSRYSNPHWDRYASFTRNRFGAGEAWYLGCSAAPDTLKDCLSRAAQAAGISGPALRWPLIIRSRGGLRFIFNYSDEEQTFSCPVGGRDVLSGLRYTNGQVCTLGAWQVLVIGQDS